MMKLFATTLAALAIAATGTPVLAADFNLSYASPYTETHPYGKADAEWIARIEEQSGGRVHIPPYWGGALVTSREGVDELAAAVDESNVAVRQIVRITSHRGQGVVA